METMTIKFNNKVFVTSNCWWEDGNFIFVTEDGEYRLKNAYPISLKFEGLDASDGFYAVVSVNTGM